MNRKYFRGSIILLLLMVLSRALGLVREATIANIFGVGAETDAFFVAFRIPDFLYNSLITFLLGTAFIPVFSEYLVKNGKEKAWELAWRFLNGTVVGLAVVAIALEIYAEDLVKIIAPGLQDESLKLAVNLARIMIPIVVLGGVTGIFKGILNTLGDYVSPAFIPTIYNLTVIFCIVIFSGQYGIYAIAMGTLMAALLQMVGQIPAIIKNGGMYKYSFHISDKGIREILKLLLPVTLSLIIGQVVPFFEIYLASHISSGAISYLGYANRIFMIPEGLFAIMVSSILFPVLATDLAQNNKEGIRHKLSLSLRISSFIMIPFSLVLLGMAGPVINILLGRGAFDAKAVENTAGPFGIFCIVLAANCIRNIATYTLFALRKTKVLLIVSAMIVPINIGLDLLLVELFATNGIALGYTITGFINMGILLGYLGYNKILCDIKKALSSFGKISASSGLMFGVLVLIKRLLGVKLEGIRGALGIIWVLGLPVLACLVYLLFGWMLRVEEERLLLRMALENLRGRK